MMFHITQRRWYEDMISAQLELLAGKRNPFRDVAVWASVNDVGLVKHMLSNETKQRHLLFERASVGGDTSRMNQCTVLALPKLQWQQLRPGASFHDHNITLAVDHDFCHVTIGDVSTGPESEANLTKWVSEMQVKYNSA